MTITEVLTLLLVILGRAAGVPYLVDTAPAIRPAPSVRRYSDGWAVQLALVKMLVEQVEHFLGFSYDFRYL